MPDFAQLPEAAQADYIKPGDLESKNFTIEHIGERRSTYRGVTKSQWVFRINYNGETKLLTLDKSANRDAHVEILQQNLPITNVTLDRAPGNSKAWIFVAHKKGKK